ncbi:Protein of unknown function [Cotesia congregata]|uniref:Uncharacterized protein n=1 Tax=Cotesia congregata TaxID=51543 RepID=A0A8J2H754_COTCN|nr:Protein of unknown function [Cotesia congregata]
MAFNTDMYVTTDVWFPFKIEEIEVQEEFYESRSSFYEFSEDKNIIISFKSELILIDEKKFILISVQEQIALDDFPLMFVPVWYLTRNYGPDDKYTINIEVEKKPPGTD